MSAHGIDRIELEIGSVSSPTLEAREVRGALVIDAEAPNVSLRIGRIDPPGQLGPLTDLAVRCRGLVVREPRFGCETLELATASTPFGVLAARGRIDFLSDAQRLALTVRNAALAGGTVSARARIEPSHWEVDAQLQSLRASALQKQFARWLSLPKGWTADAALSGRIQAESGSPAILANVALSATAVNFSNAEGTIVAENVVSRLEGRARLGDTRSFELELQASAGQALADTVLFDFGAHPLRLTATGGQVGEGLRLTKIDASLHQLLAASGRAELAWRPKLRVVSAELDAKELRFPAAYTSFLQLALAATDFGRLETSGVVRGQVHIADNAVSRLAARLERLDIEDANDKFALQGARGELNWARDARAPPAPSYLAWNRGSAYGLTGGAARIDFRARGLGVELVKPARLPIFDGALHVRSLAVREIGRRDAELDFDAVIEPISMPLLSRAFGWPELSGRVSGSIPGVTYRNRVLTVQGDVQAQVFDGIVTGSNFRLQDPLGAWPRLYADITARSLDLELVTRTFPIGSITGRLDADIRRLELFNWSPVAFDAQLYTTPNDRSPHRISQKAVTSISSIGGGASGVAAALQSGVLRFFDEFKYDRIGIRCQLRNEVCLMGGMERGGVGYYIVKGRSIPRIDIIGNTGRVDWPELTARVAAAMRARGDVEVR